MSKIRRKLLASIAGLALAGALGIVPVIVDGNNALPKAEANTFSSTCFSASYFSAANNSCTAIRHAEKVGNKFYFGTLAKTGQVSTNDCYNGFTGYGARDEASGLTLIWAV